ncbi:hypothetical protein FZEAL_2956 [Fusarium zealandicum]|uniref:Uncharacterized protein n=1 Tax=Fusarium zealandicum TaxID=1053134 RepID=A0A8H4UPP9_9HYPO|nr:hypothetical protein FZEAL_2956 [Fusarium zealandicum]
MLTGQPRLQFLLGHGLPSGETCASARWRRLETALGDLYPWLPPGVRFSGASFLRSSFSVKMPQKRWTPLDGGLLLTPDHEAILGCVGDIGRGSAKQRLPRYALVVLISSCVDDDADLEKPQYPAWCGIQQASADKLGERSNTAHVRRDVALRLSLAESYLKSRGQRAADATSSSSERATSRCKLRDGLKFGGRGRIRPASSSPAQHLYVKGPQAQKPMYCTGWLLAALLSAHCKGSQRGRDIGFENGVP